MMRTKWMRLGVRDPADILRWAAQQDARLLDDFRYRVIGGREFVSFRMVPRYEIEIGTSDIIVVAHVKAGARQVLAAAAAALWRKLAQRIAAVAATLKPAIPLPAEPRTAELYELAPMRIRSPLRGR